MIAVALLAMLAPLAIHLLSKRTPPIVEWAAMQFLELARADCRRIRIDDTRVLILRALLVLLAGLAFAGLSLPPSWVPLSNGSEPRDTVLVVDASGSTSLNFDGIRTRDRVVGAVDRILSQARPGDRFAVVVAGSVPTFLVPLFTADVAEVRAALDRLPPSLGSAAISEAIRLAKAALKPSARPGSIVVLSDNRRHGWADRASLERLELLADDSTRPIRIVNLRPDWPTDLFDASAEPIVPSRLVAVAGREVRFKTGLRWTGTPPPGTALPQVFLEIDGRPVATIPLPPNASPNAEGGGRIPLAVTHRFAVAGSHLVRVRVADDALPADNVQELALEVLAGIPVLLIDGQPPTVRPRRSDYLRTALAPEGDPTPTFLVRTIAVASLRPEMLAEAVVGDPESRPRLAILADVARLDELQTAAIERFVQDGGGLLILPGATADAKWYESKGFRGGRGWMPARFADAAGDETDLARAPRIVLDSLLHPSVEALREVDAGLGRARFPRSHALQPARDSSVVASLDDRRPLLVEKAFGRGRAMVAAVPFDATWGTNLPRLGDYVRLTHELAGWLAGAGRADIGTPPGQPLIFVPKPSEVGVAVTVDLPDGSRRRLEPSPNEPSILRDASLPGSYRFRAGDGAIRWQVVRGDPEESDTTALSAEDRRAIGERLPGATWCEDLREWNRDESQAGGARIPLAGLLLLLAVALMFAEVRLLRR